MSKYITELFVFIDDFCKAVDQHELNNGNKKPTRTPKILNSEIMTIIIMFQQSGYKNFKCFYLNYLQLYKKEFPNLVSYNRFVELKSRVISYFCLLIQWFCLQNKGGNVHFIDSTKISACHNRRIYSHKVLKEFAERGKTSMGWFYGFKLHFVINDQGELQGCMLTSGNVDDRVPVESIMKKLKGLLFGDKGYISQKLFDKLYEKGIKIITSFKANMKNKLMFMKEKTLLRKRGIVESVNNILKNTFQLEHTRHRSSKNFYVHIASTLVAYCLKINKPSISMN